MTKVDEAILEIEDALVTMQEPHEGLRDYATLDIKEETRSAVTDAITLYDTRKQKLESALATLRDLAGHHAYPELEIADVSESVYADLTENARTIHAALSRFDATPEAVSLGLTPGTPEPK